MTDGRLALEIALAWGLIAGAVLFSAAWVILGGVRPGYSWVTQPISGLGIGPGAALMNTAFVVLGVLTVTGTLGTFSLMKDIGSISRCSCVALLALSGLGAILCGLYTWESFAPHMAGSTLGLAGPIAGFSVAGFVLRRSPRWRRLGTGLVCGAALTLLLVAVFFSTFSVDAVLANRGIAGLMERLLTLDIHAWYITLAVAAIGQHAPRKAYKGLAMEGFVASWYAKITKSQAHAQHECARRIADSVPAGGRVLEIAPGPGYLAIALARLGRQDVCGLDISRTFVEIATANARAAGVDVAFQLGNASAMPYPNASFDFVICRAAFKNFSDPLGAVNEIYRVLKPGGGASILDLRRESSPEDVRALVDGMNLSRLSALWTSLTFRFFLLKNAYSRDSLQRLAVRSRFGACDIHEGGVEYDLRFSKRLATPGTSAA